MALSVGSPSPYVAKQKTAKEFGISFRFVNSSCKNKAEIAEIIRITSVIYFDAIDCLYR